MSRGAAWALALLCSFAFWALFALSLYAGTHRDGALYAALQMVAVFGGVVAVGLLGAALTLSPRERARR